MWQVVAAIANKRGLEGEAVVMEDQPRPAQPKLSGPINKKQRHLSGLVTLLTSNFPAM